MDGKVAGSGHLSLQAGCLGVQSSTVTHLDSSLCVRSGFSVSFSLSPALVMYLFT